MESLDSETLESLLKLVEIGNLDGVRQKIERDGVDPTAKNKVIEYESFRAVCLMHVSCAVVSFFLDSPHC